MRTTKKEFWQERADKYESEFERISEQIHRIESPPEKRQKIRNYVCFQREVFGKLIEAKKNK